MNRKSNMHYIYTNPHPRKIKTTTDCSVRALANATGNDWLTVYDELTKIGRELMVMPNDVEAIAEYLKTRATKFPTVIKNGKRMTAQDLPKNGTYVVRIAHHVMAVKNGKVRDTWDSSNKAAYIIWKMEK